MRLDDFDPNINVGDQGNRGGGFGGGGGGNLLLGLLPLIGSRFGCGGVVVVLLLFAVFGGGLGGLGSLFTGGQVGVPTQRTAPARQSAAEVCTTDPAKRAACNAFSNAQQTWAALYATSGQRFEPPSLQFFDRNGESGCGAAQAAMGPFYCPTDQSIYLDVTFFDELAARFRAQGDFAQYYVIAHEFGHHIQNLTGATDRVQNIQRQSSAQEGNAASVRLELQADCYAGVWAAANRERLEPGDLEEGLTAASAIGDDTLQRQAGGRVSPESFTHGTSAQRSRWLRVGLETGDPNRCDTFSGAI